MSKDVLNKVFFLLFLCEKNSVNVIWFEFENECDYLFQNPLCGVAGKIK